MQVQDDRRLTQSPGESKPTHPNHSLSFSRPSGDASFDLFAEIFQTISAAPPAGDEGSRLNTPAIGKDQPQSQPSAVRDRRSIEDEFREEPHADSIAPYELPAPIPLVLVDGEVEVELVEVAQTSAGTDDALAGAASVQDQVAKLQPTSETIGPVDETPDLQAMTVPVAAQGNAAQGIESQPIVLESAQSLAAEVAGAAASGAVAETQAESASRSEAVPTNDEAVLPSLGEAVSQTDDPVAPSDAANEGEAALDNVDADSSGRDGGEQSERKSAADRRASKADRGEGLREQQPESPQRSAASSPVDTRSAAGQSESVAASQAATTTDRGAPSGPLSSPSAAAGAASVLSAATSGMTNGPATGISGSTPLSGVNSAAPRTTERAAAGDSEPSGQTQVADRARLVQRIAKAFQRIGVDGGQVRLKMHPEELGGVQLELNVNGRKVNATVIADSESARQLLQDNLPELRQRLESQGLIVERLEVQRRGDSGDSGLANQNQQQNGTDFGDPSGGQAGLWRRQNAANNRKTDVSASAMELARPPRSFLSDRALDLKV